MRALEPPAATGDAAAVAGAGGAAARGVAQPRDVSRLHVDHMGHVVQVTGLAYRAAGTRSGDTRSSRETRGSRGSRNSREAAVRGPRDVRARGLWGRLGCAPHVAAGPHAWTAGRVRQAACVALRAACVRWAWRPLKRAQGPAGPEASRPAGYAPCLCESCHAEACRTAYCGSGAPWSERRGPSRLRARRSGRRRRCAACHGALGHCERARRRLAWRAVGG